ncbi:MAG: metallophosphoesterase [Saprospiraceae bacterium]
MYRTLIQISLLFTVCSLTAQTAKDSFLVKPYLQFATQHGIYILWETTSPATTLVEYGEALVNADKPNLSQTVGLEGTRLLHEVKLDNLKPATKYVYRTRSTTENGQIIMSEVYTFKTAVNDDDAYFFAFIGDTQQNDRTPWAWGKIAGKVWGERPNFIINAGDLVDMGTRKTDWTEQFFSDGHIAMSRFPMYTVLGNHEQDAHFYYDYMVNPAPEYRYTFNYGNAQFFMIDTNRDVFEGSEQYDWLEWELAQSTATWKFVVHHHPPYSSEENDHGDTYIGASTFQTQARNLVPLYEAYGVDFCLFGHTHLYERTWPIFNNTINQENGVVYINSGGGGGGLEDFDPARSWFTQNLKNDHHYCTFAVFDKTLVFRAVDHEGRLFDTFQMQKKGEGEDSRGSMVQPPAPHFEIDKMIFQDQATVKISSLLPAHKIYFTLDGSEPNMQSKVYSGPVIIDKTCTLKTRAYTPDGKASRVVERTFRKMQPLPAVKTGKTESGLQFSYYEGSWKNLPDFKKLTPVKTGVANKVNLEKIGHRDNQFAVVLEGFVDLPKTGTYQFFTRSDDGSKLYIDGELVVDNDGDHGAFWEYGTTILEKGKHRLRVEYFDASGYEYLSAGIMDEEGFGAEFKEGMLSH